MRLLRAGGVTRKNEKTPQFLRGVSSAVRTSEPDNLARFHHTQQMSNRTSALATGHFPGIEPQIISTIKTIRKKN